MSFRKCLGVFVLVVLVLLSLAACAPPPPDPESRLEFPDAGDGCIRVLIVHEEPGTPTDNADLREEYQEALNNLEYEIVKTVTIYDQSTHRMVIAEIYYRVPNCP